MGEISQEAFRFLRGYIEQECGIALNADKQFLVETRLRDVLREEGVPDYMTLYLKARDESSNRIRNRIVDAMTTNETLWFRDGAPFKVFEEVLLPVYEEEIREGRRKEIRVWSSACSTGQEPYSMALSFLERARNSEVLDIGHLKILGTDISDQSLAQAREGVYSGFAMERGLPDALRHLNFQQEGRNWRLAPEIREMVTFRNFNLQDSFSMLGTFDIVLTRYVALYFSQEFKRALFRKIHRLLYPKGHLFLGGSETLGDNTEGFQQLSHGRQIYYSVQTPQPMSGLPALDLVTADSGPEEC